jgi:UDP-N-acetylglucosamine transferase subunit ALG13
MISALICERKRLTCGFAKEGDRRQTGDTSAAALVRETCQKEFAISVVFFALERVGATETTSKKLRILVVGGSQGARAVNDLVTAAAEILSAANVDFTLMHQTGNADLDRIQKRYHDLGLGERVVLKTFIDDIATAYAESDLVVARAGALTLAELAIAGKPAILIPLPTAADDHQRKNAERFAHAGAAVMLVGRTCLSSSSQTPSSAGTGLASAFSGVGSHVRALPRKMMSPRRPRRSFARWPRPTHPGKRQESMANCSNSASTSASAASPASCHPRHASLC